MPVPPEIAMTFARTKFARTPVATRLSPAVSVELMLAAPAGTAYCASTSFSAVCNWMFTDVGASGEADLPADRAAVLGKAGGAGLRELLAGLARRSFIVEGKGNIARKNRVRRDLRIIVRHRRASAEGYAYLNVHAANAARIKLPTGTATERVSSAPHSRCEHTSTDDACDQAHHV